MQQMSAPLLTPASSLSLCTSGGRITFDGTIDDATQTGTIKATYEQCTENGLQLDGESVLEVHEYDFVNDEIKSATIKMTDLSLIDSSSSRLLSGTMKGTTDNAAGRVTYISNVSHKNLTGGNETLSKDLKMILGGGTLVVDGQFCINADGCATARTPAAMAFDGTSIVPSSGVLTLTGAMNSSVRFNAAGTASRLFVDPEGDGSYVEVR